MRYTDHPDQAYVESSPMTKEGTRTLLSKSFLYMFIGIIITAVVAIAVALIAESVLANAQSAEQVESMMNTLLILYAVGAIGTIIMSFVNSRIFLKGKHKLYIPAIIYCILFGFVLSIVVFVTEWEVLAIALGMSALAFGLMGLIGVLSKGRMSLLYSFSMTLIIGGLLTWFITWLIFRNSPEYYSMYLIIDLVIFGAMMLLTIWDIRQISRISAAGEYSENLALYCALTLYTDFIYLFIKIVYYLSRLKDR